MEKSSHSFPIREDYYVMGQEGEEQAIAVIWFCEPYI